MIRVLEGLLLQMFKYIGGGQAVVAHLMSSQGFLELWGEGESWEELKASISGFPEELKQPWLQSHLSMKVLAAHMFFAS